MNLAPRASISDRIPWWYFCRSSTDETSLMWETRETSELVIYNTLVAEDGTATSRFLTSN